MRNIFLPAALIAALGFGGAAFAGNDAPVNQTSGAILLLQASEGGLVLQDGSRYVLPATVQVNNLSDGEHVTVSWQQNGNVKVVTSVTHAM